MLTRCTKCGKEVDEDADICPHCKFDFTKQVLKGTGRRVGDIGAYKPPPKQSGNKKDEDLPAHMLADINAPPKEESVLPPHMLEGAAATEADLLSQSEEDRIKSTSEKSGSPAFYLLVGAVICGAILAPKFLKKDAPPVNPEAAAPPAVSEAKTTKLAEAAKRKRAGSTAKLAEADPPALEDGPPPRPRKSRRTRRRTIARAPPAPAIPLEEIPLPKKKVVSKFRVRGKVLNLVTLEGVPDATLTFTSPGGQVTRTESGSGGKFRVTLKGNSGGYDLAISHKDFDSKWLPENGHKAMTEEERQAIAEALIKSYPKNKPLMPGSDGNLKQEFVLVPRPKHGVTMEEALLK